MGVQPADEQREVIPWPEGADTCPIPGTSYALKNVRRPVNGRPVPFLGRGGEGYVYLAESTNPLHRGRPVAVKFLTFAGPYLEVRVQDFLANAPTLLSRINFTYVAATLDLLDLQALGSRWPPVAMVMDHFPCSLQDVVEEAARWDRPLPLQAALTWANHIIRGVEDLHDIAQVVHRDLKPSNIMLRAAQGGGLAWMPGRP